MSDYWTRVVARILPDMRREVSRWTVLKNHDSLPTVPGDIDLCLHRSDWELFTQHLGKALSQCGNFMMLVCDHYLGVRLVFVVPTDRPYVDSALELDLADGIWWKGHQLVEAAEIVRAGLDDPRGFKGAPPGTEAGFHLTIQVLDRFGRLRQGARHFQRLDDLAHQDPFGFCAAMERMHGPIGRRAAGSFLNGDWKPLLGLLLILRRTLHGPLGIYRTSLHWLKRRWIGHWRGLPRDVPKGANEWLARVGTGHRVEWIGSQSRAAQHDES